MWIPKPREKGAFEDGCILHVGVAASLPPQPEVVTGGYGRAGCLLTGYHLLHTLAVALQPSLDY